MVATRRTAARVESNTLARGCGAPAAPSRPLLRDVGLPQHPGHLERLIAPTVVAAGRAAVLALV